MKAHYTAIAVLMSMAVLISACVQIPATSAPQPAAKPTQGLEPQKLITWFQYDQGNVDPASDERVGNEYLRKTIPLFNQTFAGKWTWENRYTPWDKIEATIVAAVRAQDEVPDLVEVNSGSVNQFYKNGTMQDLTAWAQAQTWWSDMDPSAIKTCTGPDGKLYCIPMAERPGLVFAWRERFPNGFPTTPEQFLAEGERLKKEGLYALTFFGSTDYNGDGVHRGVWTTIASFGGTYDDGKGHLLLNTPENVAAIEWLRTMVQKGYVPEIAFAGQFAEEAPFRDSTAAAFPTGLYGYRYINPLTAPSGKKYATKTEQDMLDAIAAGDIILRPMVAPAGKKPGCQVSAPGLSIPVGAKNPDAAYDFINWLLAPGQNPAYVLGPGAGFPVLKAIQALPEFQTPLYQQAAAAINASACRPWFGSLENQAAAKKAIMAVIYRLIKQDPTADIAAELIKAQDDFNKQQ